MLRSIGSKVTILHLLVRILYNFAMILLCIFCLIQFHPSIYSTRKRVRAHKSLTQDASSLTTYVPCECVFVVRNQSPLPPALAFFHMSYEIYKSMVEKLNSERLDESRKL